MGGYSEHDVRQAERYREAKTKRDAQNPTAGAWICIAGAILVLAGIAFGPTGDTDPMFQLVIGAVCFLGGGAYWLHARSETRKAESDMGRIETHFRGKGLSVSENGTITPR